MLPEVKAFIDAAPEAQRPALLELREMIVAAYPEATEAMYNGQFPVYLRGEEWLSGFALRSKGPMLYIMDQALVTENAGKLGGLASGKACLLYKPTKSLDNSQLRELFAGLLIQAAARRKR